MPTVEEIFKDPPEFCQNSEGCYDNIGEDVESLSDNPVKIEPRDQIFMTMVHNSAELI